MRTITLALIAGIVVAACSGAVDGPAVASVEEVCIAELCVGYPVGWDVVEEGEDFISFEYPGIADVVATVGRVNMEGVVVNAGGSWPQPARTVVDYLWSLLDDGEAELASVGLVVGGALDSEGSISTGWMWYRLVPVTSSMGVGVEIRGPNTSWEPHADVFRQTVRVLNSDL